MPQLLRLRFVSLGHPQARMEDLVLDFQGPDGQPSDSTLWLRNGGGKSSILNLFFTIVRPHRGEFLGGKAEAKQRSLTDYILVGDRAVAAAEWQLDPAADSLGVESERFVTGVFNERSDGSRDLRRLFFSCRVSDDNPESTLDNLPLYASSNGARARRTLGAFREAWRSLRDQAPHLAVTDTENQREWQDVLEAARIDPELFSYQVRMNQREGGADELFRFAEPEDFVDFLLELALDPALGNRVGRNITAFRRELLQRREKLLPERELVTGLLSRMGVVRDIQQRRERLRVHLGEMRDDLGGLDQLATLRLEELRAEIEEFEQKRSKYITAADEHRRQASNKRARAAQLRQHGAKLRLEKLKDEHEQVQKEWQAAQRLAKIWAAAVPLRRALKFENKAADQRRSLEKRETEHAPLRAELRASATQLASALSFRSQEHRKSLDEARKTESAAREEASDYRAQAHEAGKLQSKAETQAKNFREKLSGFRAKQTQLVREGVLGADEAAEVCVAWWTAKTEDYDQAIARIEAEIKHVDRELDALAKSLDVAAEVVSDRKSDRHKLVDLFERAKLDRAALEEDPVLRRALELESIDADRISTDAVHTVEQEVKTAQRVVVEARLAVADDEHAALHIEEHGLLPPSSDTQHIVEYLGSRLGGQAWSGWSWIQANIPKQDARDAVRKAPSLAQGVVVRPDDFERAIEILDEAGVEPDGPVLIVATDAQAQAPELPGVVAGPKETAWFDRDVAQRRLTELRVTLEQQQRSIQTAEAQHVKLTRSCEALRSFRDRYEVGWFAQAEQDLRDAEEREVEAHKDLLELQEQRKLKAQRQKELERQGRDQVRELEKARATMRRVNEFVEDYAGPSATWQSELQETVRRAEQHGEEVRQWGDMAEAADVRATEASSSAQRHGEEARVLESEHDGLEYVEGDFDAKPGDLDALRGRYRLLCNRYEEKVGADALLALARQNDDNAREERSRLAKLLSEEITDTVVQENLDKLTELDTVEQLREDAEVSASSLQGKMGNLKGRIDPAEQAVQETEKALDAFEILPPLRRVPGTPELAEADATTLEREAELHRDTANSEQEKANEAMQGVEQLRDRVAQVERSAERLSTLREDYADLLDVAANLPGAKVLPATLEESILSSQLRKLADDLRQARSEWQQMDTDRGSAASTLRAFAAGPDFERLDAPWLLRLQEHDDSALEDASEKLCAQLELRRDVLEEQISGIERHRAVLVDELHAVAEEGMKLLRQASSLSKLPDHVPGIGGAHFLRIQTREPDEPDERRARLAELIDELVDGKRDLGGVDLVQAAVRRLARPVQVRVLHPDPALDRRTVSIPEMARSSGGEQLTGAILLYCTLARVRGRSRGLSRRASSILILDNPIGRASRIRFLELQRDVARAMGVQLIYTTGVNDHEALRALPNVIRLRNERVDRNSGRRLVEHVADETYIVEAVRLGRREDTDAERPEP